MTQIQTETPVPVEINRALPPDLMAGFDIAGRLIVCIETVPIRTFIFGNLADEDHVMHWSVGEKEGRRLFHRAFWRQTGYHTDGTA